MLKLNCRVMTLYVLLKMLKILNSFTSVQLEIKWTSKVHSHSFWSTVYPSPASPLASSITYGYPNILSTSPASLTVCVCPNHFSYKPASLVMYFTPPLFAGFSSVTQHLFPTSVSRKLLLLVTNQFFPLQVSIRPALRVVNFGFFLL